MNLPRLRIPFAAVFILLSLLAVRLFYIQVIKGLTYVELAEKQFVRKVRTETNRGDIYDRNGCLLATTLQTQSFYMHPKEFDRSRENMGYLQNAFSMTPREVQEKLASGEGFVWLQRKMDAALAAEIGRRKVRGIGMTPEQDRYYPNGSLACHVLGSVGLDNHGLAGLEQSQDSFLTGNWVLSEQVHDAKGRKIQSRTGSQDGERAEKPAADKNIVLTLDRSLQYLAEKEIQRGVEDNRAESGIAVIQNPRTGEILAMACYPNFDPNVFPKGRLPENFQTAHVQNPAVNKMFEPGSTFKIVAFAAALEKWKDPLSRRIDCEGGKWKFKDVTINDHEPEGEIPFARVMEKSSNIGTAKIGMELGKETLYRYARAFGFGTKTGIALPGETAGLLRHPKEWSQVSLPVMSFGQEVGVTALQIIGAFSAIANGGVLMEASIIRQRSVPVPGGDAGAFEPQPVRRVVSEGTAAALRGILTGVVERGTGDKARVPGYRVAGKTGTAQKIDPRTKKYSSEKYLASFCGFLPADDPKLVCLVLLDNPRKDYWGGSTAAPVFSRIMTRAVQILGIPSDAPKAPMAGRTRSVPEGSVRTAVIGDKTLVSSRLSGQER